MKKSKSSSTETKGTASPSKLIDARIKELGDWRGEMLARVRALIKQADPEVIETWKWRGVPVWEHDGILFNSSLEGNVRRAIDIREGDKIDEKALKALIRAAVALNMSKRPPARAQKRPKSA